MDILVPLDCNCKPFGMSVYIIDGDAHHFKSITWNIKRQISETTTSKVPPYLTQPVNILDTCLFATCDGLLEKYILCIEYFYSSSQLKVKLY